MNDPILILHGWGRTVSGQRFARVKKLLESKGHTVYTPDLPGFGVNSITKSALQFEDYIDFVNNFLNKKKLKRIILIGHSFGGRIAIAFTAKNPNRVSHLILTGSSGIPHTTVKKIVIYSTAKLIKSIFTLPFLSAIFPLIKKIGYKAIGETDYNNAGNLKQTFKNVYQVNILPDLEKIIVPTDIIWAEKDTMTPLSDGKIMHRKIYGSRLIIVPNTNHTLPYENPDIFVREVLQFLK